MKKFLILNLLFFAPSLIAQDGGESGPGVPATTEPEEFTQGSPGVPGKIMELEETTQGPGQPIQEAQISSYNLEGGLSGIPNPFSPDGTKVITFKRPAGGHSVDQPWPKSFINIWNTSDGSLITTFELEEEYPSLITWHPNSKMIISGRLMKSTLWKLPN